MKASTSETNILGRIKKIGSNSGAYLVSGFFNNLTDRANVGLALFFLSLYIIYPLQVVFQSTHLAVLPYLLLIPCMTILAKDIANRQPIIASHFKFLSFLVLGHLLFIVYSVGIEVYTQNFMAASKLVLGYMFPLLLFFYIPRYVSEKNLLTIFNILIILSVIHSTVVIYEFIKVSPTFYEKQNVLYATLRGWNTNGLIGGFRPVGLLDHFSTTTFLLGFGLVGSFIFYLHEGPKTYMAASLLCGIGMVLSGGRLALIASASCILFVSFVCLKTEIRKGRIIRRLAHFIVPLIVVILSLYLLTRHNTQFWGGLYGHLFTTGEFAPNRSLFQDVILRDARAIVSRLSLIASFIGYGITTLSAKKQVLTDDVFILQIYGQLGIFGGMIFYSMFFVGIYKALSAIKKVELPQKPLILFSACLLFMFLVSTIHLNQVFRKLFYPLIFLSLGVIAKSQRSVSPS